MKKALLIFLIFVFSIGFATCVSAETEDFVKEQVLIQAEQIESIDFKDNLSQILSGDLDLSAGNILHKLSKLIVNDTKENATALIKVVVLAVLAGILSGLSHNLPASSGVSEISFLACFSVIAGLAVTIVFDMMQLATETIDSLFVFMSSLLPIIGNLIVSGYSTSFAGFYPTLFVSMQSFTFLSRNVFLPMIIVITVLSVVNAISGRFHITRLIDLSRRLVKWGIGLLLTIYVGILGARGLTATVMQGVTGRTVRYALGNFVPLVGGVLAESAEAVLTGLRVIKGAVGLAGVLAIIVLCGAPLIKMLIVSLLYRFAAGVTEPATDKRVVKLLGELAENITLMFVILLMVSVMFIISIALLCSLIL